ncbi:MAG: inositol monophosphatase family protein [Deltaproteobacteria bacterium]|nr:inositol monophosphatase family protein [Deltaproteobacteria bacterium]
MSSPFLQIAVEAAQLAGKIQMEELGKRHQIEFKGEIDLVTEVDRACEKLIVEKIQKVYPDHDFLAEEGGGTRRHSDYKWVIDPLDGTINYAHGYPLFCTSIALEHKGEIIAGAIYEPNRDEMFTAEKDCGSFLNGKKIEVSKTAELIRSLLVTGFAYNLKKTRRNNFTLFKNVLLAAQAVRRDGVAAVDLCYVACGRYDAFWEMNLFPWDVAAGALILSEAGGRLSDFSGNPFSIYDKEICASNGALHDQLTGVLTKKEVKRTPLEMVKEMMNAKT